MVANRLSEDGNISVLLVEAGGAPSFVTGIPALAAHIQLSPYDWQHKTVRQENACLAMHNQAMFANSYTSTFKRQLPTRSNFFVILLRF